MKLPDRTPGHHAVNFGNMIIVFVAGGIFIHLFIMLLDYYLMTWPLYLNLRENFMAGIFSAPMLPMMTTYGLFSVATYFLWKKMKKAASLARERELRNEKVRSVLKSMQQMTGILAEHISTQNAQILNWVDMQKAQGRTVSKKIQQPSEQIAKTLQSLSEVSFVFPYTEKCPENVADIEGQLKGKLFQNENYRNKVI